MAAKWIARVLGIVVALLAIAGLFVEGDHLGGFANVDLTLDIARIVIAVALLWVGFGRVTRTALSTVLAVVGVVYVLMGIVALFDAEMFGLLPTGFTGFDIAFHIVAGLVALVGAFLPASTEPRAAADGPTVATGR
ncbi:hypothetical protein DVJ78_17245 [Humibacter sp. BT305]|nr:hypothetical protein DVJ78_17245 [Humibacter sp. BT305]